MTSRRYYSVRTGKDPGETSFDLEELRELFYSAYTYFDGRGYFEQAVAMMGPDPEAYAFLRLRKRGLFPIRPDAPYSENDIFDLIEFLHDHVSKPEFIEDLVFYKEDEGQEEFREALNGLLVDYQGGWELSPDGEILSKGETGLDQLLRAELPPIDQENVNARVEAAVRKFRNRGSSIEDRGDAVRDLAATLEYLRPQAKAVLTRKDESDLFELANQFGIRHHDQRQKTDYDRNIWLSWAFYYYLATIHATVRLIERETGKTPTV